MHLHPDVLQQHHCLQSHHHHHQYPSSSSHHSHHYEDKNCAISVCSRHRSFLHRSFCRQIDLSTTDLRADNLVLNCFCLAFRRPLSLKGVISQQKTKANLTKPQVKCLSSVLRVIFASLCWQLVKFISPNKVDYKHKYTCDILNYYAWVKQLHNNSCWC